MDSLTNDIIFFNLAMDIGRPFISCQVVILMMQFYTEFKRTKQEERCQFILKFSFPYTGVSQQDC